MSSIIRIETSHRLLLGQAVQRTGTEHQVNGMNPHHRPVPEQFAQNGFFKGKFPYMQGTSSFYLPSCLISEGGCILEPRTK